MPRKNHRTHHPKRRRYETPDLIPRAQRSAAPQPNLKRGSLVLPVGKCGRKLMFTLEDAPEALRQAQQKRRMEGSASPEKRYYQCEHCNHYHLTSRETYNDRSAQ